MVVGVQQHCHQCPGGTSGGTVMGMGIWLGCCLDDTGNATMLSSVMTWWCSDGGSGSPVVVVAIIISVVLVVPLCHQQCHGVVVLWC